MSQPKCDAGPASCPGLSTTSRPERASAGASSRRLSALESGGTPPYRRHSTPCDSGAGNAVSSPRREIEGELSFHADSMFL